MLNIIWSVMILTGILWGGFCGSLDEVTQGMIASCKEAVSLGITMLGIMSFWCGIMEIGERAGLMEWLTERMDPILSFLFPELSGNHPARKPIAANIIANILGLGMAATPAGLNAMKALQEQAENSPGYRPGYATDAMCTFLIINISSLQLIPMNLIAYRSEYGSSEPMSILGPALISTVCSTVAAVLFCKGMDWINKRRFVDKRGIWR